MVIDLVDYERKAREVIQAAIIEQFAPRFAPGSVVLHMGDPADEELV